MCNSTIPDLNGQVNHPESSRLIKFTDLDSVLNFPSPTPESPADSLSLLLSLEEAEYTTDFLKQHIIELVCDLAGMLRRGCEEAAKALLDRIIELMEALAFWMKRLQRLEGVSNG